MIEVMGVGNVQTFPDGFMIRFSMCLNPSEQVYGSNFKGKFRSSNIRHDESGLEKLHYVLWA